MNKHKRVDRRCYPRRRGWVALLPLLFLVVMMVFTGYIMGDFSKIPMIIIFMLTGILSLFTLRGYSLEDRVRLFSRGAGDTNLLLMIWIFVLAGAFASSANAMGAVATIVDLTLACIPSSILLSGIFFASCLVSICIGTSVGTIVALIPIATEVANRMEMSLPLIVAAVVGGSFFGDNLSFISDTTVVATRTQGCTMRDKLRTNFLIVLPAAIICFIIYFVIGTKEGLSVNYTYSGDICWWRVLPYVMVLITAIGGLNVLLVLLTGIMLTGVVGITDGSYSVAEWLTSMCEGIANMGELILISMIVGGVLAVVRSGGGVTFLVHGLTRRIHSRRGAECCISALVALTNCCTANNTVAILSIGPIAKDISKRYGVDKRRAASLLDIFSCVVQGVIPYGAQVLIASGLAMISPLDILPYLYYPLLLLFSALFSIYFYNNRKESKTSNCKTCI